MAVTRLDLQSAIGQYMNMPGRGFMLGIGVGAQYTAANSVGGVAGNPINGEIGWAPGALFINPLTAVAGNYLWTNTGTNTSAVWSSVMLNDGAGSDTFANLWVTGVLHGGTTGLTINGANTGAGTIGLGGTTDTTYLGSATPFGGNASAALGLGAPSHDSTGTNISAGAGTTVKDDSLLTGGLGSTSYTLSDVVYMLKAKGILKP
jgi:hypothetical protein